MAGNDLVFRVIAQTQQFEQNIKRSQQQMQTFRSSVERSAFSMRRIGPAFQNVGYMFEDMASQAGNLSAMVRAGSNNFSAMLSAVHPLAGAIGGLASGGLMLLINRMEKGESVTDKMTKALERQKAAMDSIKRAAEFHVEVRGIGDVAGLTDRSQGIGKELSALGAQRSQFQDQIKAIQEQRKRINEALANAERVGNARQLLSPDIVPGAVAGGLLGGKADQLRQKEKALRERIAAIDAQREEMEGQQRQILDRIKEKRVPEFKQQQEAERRALAQRRIEEEAKRRKELEDRAKGIKESVRTPVENISLQITEAQDLFRKKLLEPETFRRVLEQGRESLEAMRPKALRRDDERLAPAADIRTSAGVSAVLRAMQERRGVTTNPEVKAIKESEKAIVARIDRMIQELRQQGQQGDRVVRLVP